MTDILIRSGLEGPFNDDDQIETRRPGYGSTFSLSIYTPCTTLAIQRKGEVKNILHGGSENLPHLDGSELPAQFLGDECYKGVFVLPVVIQLSLELEDVVFDNGAGLEIIRDSRSTACFATLELVRTARGAHRAQKIWPSGNFTTRRFAQIELVSFCWRLF